VPEANNKRIPAEQAHPWTVQDVFKVATIIPTNHAAIAIVRDNPFFVADLLLNTVLDRVFDQLGIGKPASLRIAESAEIQIFNRRKRPATEEDEYYCGASHCAGSEPGTLEFTMKARMRASSACAL
jgi:hypothetical protein